ncbi:acetyltransferase, GNAT family protein [Pedobacter sp. BAL39]|uniref:GNAT family N-acetyltransferase n=1 Tax=Pedobacter sp. BAL39 TaxID=391596 RepID=UPI0001559B96|nr:GNAT family protein [Pedobacter sp. BAL39]EDM38347.1 acetyltransferase, GNAT family protein [Pedobacter sp. BAL39]
MKTPIFLRPLAFSDASVSFHWRNNVDVWKFTNYTPSVQVTREIEEEWMHKVLSRTDERRCAICLSENGRYIGNVQLIKINKGEAEFHLFIGEPAFWGMGIGRQATAIMLNIAFGELELERVLLQVYKDNQAAINIYSSFGFEHQAEEPERIVMQLAREAYLQQHLAHLL